MPHRRFFEGKGGELFLTEPGAIGKVSDGEMKVSFVSGDVHEGHLSPSVNIEEGISCCQ